MATLRRLGAAFLFALLLTVSARAQNYTAAPITNAFLDISTIGTTIEGAQADDRISVPYYFADVAPGFSFPFYGVNREVFRVSSNGILTFRLQEVGALSSNASFTTLTTPTAGLPNDYIAPFWDYLDNDGGTPTANEKVNYYYDQANARFIVQWTNARRYNSSGNFGDQTFQIQMYATGVVELHYATMTDVGSSYTVAVENMSGTSATAVYASTGTPTTGSTAITSNAAYRFTYSAPTAVPACASTYVPANNNTTFVAGANGLQWTAPSTSPANVAGYRVYIGTTAGAPTDIVNGAVVTQTTQSTPANFFFPFAAAPSTPYYWQVIPFNVAGTATGCPVNTFTSATGTTLTPTATTPVTQAFSGTSLPTGWVNDAYDTNKNWTVASTAAGGPLADHTTGAGAFAFVNDGISTSPDGNPTNLVLPAINLSSATLTSGTRLKFFFQNSRAGVSDAIDIPILYVDASTNGGTWTTLATITGSATTWTPQLVSLASYVGQARVFIRFRVAEVGGGQDNYVSIDDIEIGLAGATAFALSPNVAAGNLVAAGTCSGGIVRTATFSVSNTGGGSLNVTGVALSGSSAFSFATPPTTGSYGEGAGTTFQVVFNPTAAQTGPQTTVLTITYNLNGGAAQTRTVSLYGTGDAEGAGFVYRGTLSDAACTNGLALPGTALVLSANGDIGTAITALSADDATATLNFAGTGGIYPTFGAFRMFGTDYTALQINTNGTVALGTATTLSTTFVGSTVSPAGLNLIQVIANDLNMATSTYDSADPGLYAPGVYTMLADGDGDGAADDLVITWYHAYNYGSVAYTTTSNQAQYVTAQLILIQSPQANREDFAEVHYIDGAESNGTPYRLNTNVISPSTQNPYSLEGGIVTAITEAAGVEGSLYRFFGPTGLNGLGGPMYAPGGGSVGVRFQPEAQEEMTGNAGWRMLGAPVRGYTVGRLAGVNLVQGVTNQYPTYGSILYTSYNGSGYVAATSTANTLTPGNGFLWYLYNQTFDPENTDGTSNSYALPTRLEGTGAEPALTNGAYPITLAATGDGFNLLANPFRDDLDVANIASWAVGGSLVSAVPQMWDPASSSYVLASTQGNKISAWQGFMLQNGTATSLNVPPTPRTTGVVIVGREQPVTLAFELAGTRADGQGATLDQAVALHFAPEATAGWDVYDAAKLQPLTDAYATIAFLGERNDVRLLKAQDSRALNGGGFEVPMAVSAVGTGAELTLTWPGLAAVPAEWSVQLRDLVTGQTVDLRQQASYTFSVEPGRPAATQEGRAVLGQAEMARADARFVLVVNSATTGTGGASSLPTAFALHTLAPNPVAGPSALVQFDLPEASDARIEVYDMMGRRVAVVAEGNREAGRHAARLDASGLASGVYVVRMTAGQFVQAQRVTIAH